MIAKNQIWQETVLYLFVGYSFLNFVMSLSRADN